MCFHASGDAGASLFHRRLLDLWLVVSIKLRNLLQRVTDGKCKLDFMTRVFAYYWVPGQQEVWLHEEMCTCGSFSVR